MTGAGCRAGSQIGPGSVFAFGATRMVVGSNPGAPAGTTSTGAAPSARQSMVAVPAASASPSPTFTRKRFMSALATVHQEVSAAAPHNPQTFSNQYSTPFRHGFPNFLSPRKLFLSGRMKGQGLTPAREFGITLLPWKSRRPAVKALIGIRMMRRPGRAWAARAVAALAAVLVVCAPARAFYWHGWPGSQTPVPTSL